MSQKDLPLIVAVSTLIACVTVPAFRDNAGVIAPAAINAVVVLSRSRNTDDDDEGHTNGKRHR
jgi:hypothetical protein